MFLEFLFYLCSLEREKEQVWGVRETQRDGNGNQRPAFGVKARAEPLAITGLDALSAAPGAEAPDSPGL